MWTKTKSLFLSRMLTIAAAFLLLIMTFFMPAISKWYADISVSGGVFGKCDIVIPMCITLYLCEALAFGALWSLHKLLSNINNDQVFIPENTSCLRRISWICMIMGVVLFIFSLWQTIFLFAAILVIMFGLIMRVLKNVFEKAVEIKSENDFTI